MQEPFHAQRLELPLQLGRAQGLGHSAHQEELDTDRRGRRSGREPLVTRCTGLVWWWGGGGHRDRQMDGRAEGGVCLTRTPRVAESLAPDRQAVTHRPSHVFCWYLSIGAIER